MASSSKSRRRTAAADLRTLPVDNELVGSKLRPAVEVFNRLLHDSAIDTQSCFIYYFDGVALQQAREEGTDGDDGLQRLPVVEFRPVADGGDIPWHRVYKFELDGTIIWDRRRKIDLLFRSGETAKQDQDAKERREQRWKIPDETTSPRKRPSWDWTGPQLVSQPRTSILDRERANDPLYCLCTPCSGCYRCTGDCDAREGERCRGH